MSGVLRGLMTPVVIVATVGGLLPLWLGTESLIVAMHPFDVARMQDSFPHLVFARHCFAIGFAWTAAAAAIWSGVAFFRLRRPTAT